MLNLIKASGLVVGFEFITWNIAYGSGLAGNTWAWRPGTATPWVLAWREWQTLCFIKQRISDGTFAPYFLKFVKHPRITQCQLSLGLRSHGCLFTAHFFFPRTLTLREIPPFHSFSTVLFISLALPVTTTSNAPWGTWNNLGQCLRKPHYFLYSSSPWTIFVCGGILFWKIVPPISDQLSCGVRWGNSTGVWPPEELPAKS